MKKDKKYTKDAESFIKRGENLVLGKIFKNRPKARDIIAVIVVIVIFFVGIIMTFDGVRKVFVPAKSTISESRIESLETNKDDLIKRMSASEALITSLLIENADLQRRLDAITVENEYLKSQFDEMKKEVEKLKHPE